MLWHSQLSLSLGHQHTIWVPVWVSVFPPDPAPCLWPGRAGEEGPSPWTLVPM